MNVYIKHGWCFVQLTKGAMICIGQKSEIDNASDAKIVDMVWEAIAISNFKDIKKSPKTVQ